jgi:multidrug transporter EmrE-like cation transporter
VKFIIIGSIVMFAIGYAWMQTAKNQLNINIGFAIMGIGFVGIGLTAALFLHSVDLL